MIIGFLVGLFRAATLSFNDDIEMISQVEKSPVHVPYDDKEKPSSGCGWISSMEVVGASQINDEISRRWADIRAQHRHLSSPYFDLEFTKAVARVRRDVEIAIARNGDSEIVMIMPYQRVSRHRAEPVGGKLNDVHGVIGPLQHQQIFLNQLMKTASLSSIGFHAAISSGTELEPYQFSLLKSHFVDVSKGWNHYRNWIRDHSSTLRRQGQKTRALERDWGPIRFDLECKDSKVLEHLIDLKRKKYQTSRTFDILSVDWAANLLREVSKTKTDQFQGVLSVLSAGDQLVAFHFGLMSGGILHYWFPVFDKRFSRYSPGSELLLRVVQKAANFGIEKVDLGYGDDPYKAKFCNESEIVSCGCITTNRFGFKLAKQRYEIRQRLKAMPVKPLAKTLLRGVFPGFGHWNFK